jgi:hypothetical protein
MEAFSGELLHPWRRSIDSRDTPCMLRRAISLIRLIRGAHILLTLPISGVFAVIVAAWVYLQNAPLAIVVVVLAGMFAIFCVVLFALIAFLYSPPAKGIFSPRNLRWHKLPIHKVVWSFDNYLGVQSKGGSSVRVTSFQCQYRITRGDGIRPKNAFIECKRTAERLSVLIECGNPYLEAKECEFIPRGKWYQARAQFDDLGLTKEEFLRQWDGFTFVFEYDNTIFSRTFPRWEIEDYFDRFWLYCNKPSEPIPTRRANPNPVTQPPDQPYPKSDP